MSFFLYLCITLFILVCLLLIMIVLIQKGRGGGLASAFGGAGGNTAFGSKTGDVLTWVTAIIFGIFLLLAVGLNLLANYQNQKRIESAQQPALEQEAPVAPVVPSTTAPASQPAR